MIYSLILSIRHLFYDKGWIKSSPTEIKSICVGNVGVGGTGKTPMTELIIRTLDEGNVASADADLYGFEGSLFASVRPEIAVLSRGYKRKSKGFQIVKENGSAAQFGDEPLQIKRKFPFVNVVVDKDRTEGCDFLAHPEKVPNAHFPTPDIIIMDDAFQHRKVVPSKTIVLTTYNRPYFRDRLIPFGRLRDLRSRVKTADMVVVTGCPPYLDDVQKSQWANRMGLSAFDASKCCGNTRNGKKQFLLFATTVYDKLLPVFPEGDPRYTHSKFAVLMTGIANDAPLVSWLSEDYKIVDHMSFPDHHFFTNGDIADLESSAKRNMTALLVTTEKDAQRIRTGVQENIAGQSTLSVSDAIHNRLFYAPIHTQMLSAKEQETLRDFLQA